MKFKTFTLAASIAVIATTVAAHKGATGVLLERMQAMLAMGKATKAVAPMMRGQIDYDADQTRAYAAVLQTHSGKAMLALFPDGLNAKPSVAKDNVWTDWEEFSDLANDLAMYAAALDLASENGLGEAVPAVDSLMGGDTVDLMGGAVEVEQTAQTLASLPVNTLFAQSAQVCSACHSKFREEE